jgi:hypothetical protein
MMERRFTQFGRHLGHLTIDLTFNQEYAYNNPKVEFVNSSHPLIFAGADWLLDQGYHRNKAYRIGLSRDHLEGSARIEPGHYILAVFDIALNRGSKKDRSTFHFVQAAVIDANGDSPRLLPRDIAGFILGKAQLFGSEPSSDPVFDQATVDTLRPVIAREIKDCEKEIRQNEQIKLASNSERSLSQLRLFYENQIARKKSLLQEGHGIRDILLSDITKLESDFRQQIETIQSSTIECRNELVSINYLQIH